MLASLQTTIAVLKTELDALRPLSQAALAGLQKFYDVELTYTSNALEGNTLTHRETAEVIEHGITVGGKPLTHHLEALDHYDAVLWMREQASQQTPLNENLVCELHRRIVARARPDIAGIYSPHPRRIAGSPVTFPNPLKIPALMAEFCAALPEQEKTLTGIFAAHFALTAIHPLSDGNGRTARLLMNLMLLRQGYPPIAIHPSLRRDYLAALEHGSLKKDLIPFQEFLHQRLAETLQGYVVALKGA